jgi:predicted phosphoadenosine phosphosulfate sulfurtransferase
MKREEYDEYIRKFNAQDYDGVFDYYVENPKLAFFGIEINTREQLKDFYKFLHSYTKETVTVLDYVSNENFVALEAVVRIEGTRDLKKEVLVEKGYPGLYPINKYEVREIKEYIHYHLVDGKISSVGCAIPL